MENAEASLPQLNESSASSSPQPLIPLESILPLESLALSNFAAIPPLLEAQSRSSLAANMRLTLDTLCQTYHSGIRLFEEMLHTVRSEFPFDSEFIDSEEHHQMDYFESLLGAVEQNVASWHSQYDSVVSCISSVSSQPMQVYATAQDNLPASNQTNTSYSLLLESGESIPIVQQEIFAESFHFPLDNYEHSRVSLPDAANLSQILAEQQTTGIDNESHITASGVTSMQNAFESHENGEPNYFGFENDASSSMMMAPVALTNPSVLSDISNTHNFIHTAPSLDVDSELSQLFADSPSLPSSDTFLDLINQQDNAHTGLSFASSSTLGHYEDSNIILMNQDGSLMSQNNSEMYFPPEMPTTASSVSYPSNGLLPNSILNEALASPGIDRLPLHHLSDNLAILEHPHTQYSLAEQAHSYISID